MPGNIELSGLEVSLVNAMSRELVMRSYIEQVKDSYDYILIDCMPSLGMITINAFACADSILIPVQVAYLPVKGLEQLIKTIGKVKRQINPKLEIEGILLTMVDSRTPQETWFRACRKNGEMPVIVCNYTNDEATIIMVDSNIQRGKRYAYNRR
jgi:cellulose biosynthesis protein BcsQ